MPANGVVQSHLFYIWPFYGGSNILDITTPRNYNIIACTLGCHCSYLLSPLYDSSESLFRSGFIVWRIPCSTCGTIPFFFLRPHTLLCSGIFRGARMTSGNLLCERALIKVNVWRCKVKGKTANNSVSCFQWVPVRAFQMVWEAGIQRAMNEEACVQWAI